MRVVFKVGSKIMCINNYYRKSGLFNGMICYVNSVIGGRKGGTTDGVMTITYNDNVIEGEFTFNDNFVFANGYTIFKAQGRTFDFGFNCILDNECGLIYREEVLTMLSRATKFEFVNFNYYRYAGKVFPSFYDTLQSPEIVKMKKPEFSFVYNVSDRYIGKTDNIERREKEHIRDSKWFNIGVDKLVPLYSCLKSSVLYYEKREINDYIKKGYTLENKQHNRMNELLVSKTEEFSKIATMKGLPKGITADRGKFRVQRLIKGKSIKKRFDTLELAISFLENISI